MMPAPIHERLRDAAAVVGLKAAPLISDLGTAGDGYRNVVAFTDGQVTSIGVEVDMPDDVYLARRAFHLTAGISPSRVLSRAVFARPGELRGGFWAIPNDDPMHVLQKWSTVVTVSGATSLDEDLAAAAAIGLSPSSCELVATRLRALGATAAVCPRIIRAVVHWRDDEGQDSFIELGAPSVDSLLWHIGQLLPASELDREHLVTLGPVHASMDGAWVRITARPGALVPGITITYGATLLPVAHRAMAAAGGGPEAVAKLDALMTALGARTIVSLDVTLTPPGRPLAVRIGMPLT
jgi:hypothetical protein